MGSKNNQSPEIVQEVALQPWFRQYNYWALMLIVLLAVCLGSLSVALFDSGKSVGGTDNWWPMVLNVAEGRGFTSCQKQYFPFCETADQTTASREPLPILLFAAVVMLFGKSVGFALFMELLLFIATLLGIYFLARRLLNEQVALLATLGLTLYIPIYRLIPQVSGDMLATLFVTWAIYFIVKGLHTDTWLNWVAAGVYLGAGALSRSVVLYLAIVLVLALIPWRALRERPRLALVRRAALVICATALILTPWVVRNYFTFGHPVIGTTLSGYNVYRHNAVVVDKDFLRYSSPTDAELAVDQLLANHPELRGNENEYEMDQVYSQEAQKLIRSHPDRYVMLSFYRLLPLWFDIGIDEAYGQTSGILEKAIIVQQLLLLTVGLLGFWLIGRTSWVLWLPMATVTAMHMGVAARLRFVSIIMPLLMIACAFTIIYVREWSRVQKLVIVRLK